MFRAGAKNGPDVGLWGGWKKYKLPGDILLKDSNTLIVIVESFGLNRQPFALNDIRNPRGILAAEIHDATIKKWSISGIDVREHDDVFNSSGFTDENAPLYILPASPYDVMVTIPITAPVWNILAFNVPESKVNCPLRLCLYGSATCYVFLNGTLIARYYGNGDGPQYDFLMQDGLLQLENQLKILSYAENDTAVLSVEIKPWKLSDALGSGNLDESGSEFKLFKNAIKF